LAKVDISINGRVYAVACDEGQENRVRELAGMMEARVRQLTGSTPVGSFGETQILVLAGLMLADELSETKTAPAADRAMDEELLVAAVEHLTGRIADIADRLDRA
jgi:cell division protein ZapA